MSSPSSPTLSSSPRSRSKSPTSSGTPPQRRSPVFLLDRDIEHNVAKPGQDYVGVIQSDFVQEGKRAAVQMAKATGGKAKIIELEGTTGASPAIDRKKGFDEAIKQCPGMQIVVSQDADFTRAKGQSVAETLLQSHPDATVIYAHNDEMALGAIAAAKAIGRQPGKDIQVVSIDGEKDGLKAVAAGDLSSTSVCRYADVSDFEALIPDTGLSTAEAHRYSALGPQVIRT